MKKIVFIVVFIGLYNSSFSQNVSKLTVFDFMKGYNYDQIYNSCYVDSAAIFILAKEVGSNRRMMYYTEINHKTNSFKTKLLPIKHMDLVYLPNENYFRINNEIIRIRIEGAKKETKYYKEKFNGETFVEETIPFFSGTPTEGYSFMSHFKKFDKYIRMTSRNNSSNITRIVYTFFDISNFSVLNSTALTIPENENVRSVQYYELNEKLFNIYSFTDPKTKKKQYKMSMLDEFKIKNIEFNGDFMADDMILDANRFYEVNNKYYFYTLLRNEKQWENAICSIDLDHLHCKLVEKTKVKTESIYKDYVGTNVSNEIEKRFMGINTRFTNFNVFQDKNDIYIVSYVYSISSEYGAMDGDLFLTKISDNKVEWNRLVKRSPRQEGTTYLSVYFSEDVVEITDVENEVFFDDNGSWISKGKGPFIGNTKFLPVILNIDKNTGDCTRKLIK